MKAPQCNRILVVDDSEDNLTLLKILLEAEGYEVDVAQNGFAALENIEASPPGLVLLDVMMPDMDGFEVVQRIRESDSPDTPIVLITGYLDPGSEASFPKVEGFIHKPIDLDEVLKTVKPWCCSSLESA